MNRPLRTVIIAPLTSTLRSYPTRVQVMFDGRAGQVALDHIRTVDKSRLLRRLGRLRPEEGDAVLSVLQRMFAP